MLMNYLTEADLENIKNHKYKSTGYSWLDRKFEPFWDYITLNTPYVITPNMLTLIGVAFLFSGVVVAYFIDNTMTKDVSNYVRIWYAFSIFMAQTFDAIDGKHARRTNRCSPLGQLMDHSLDCLSNSFTLVMISSSFGFGSSTHTLLILIHVQLCFWFVNWEEHNTGCFRTHVDNIGGTELQLSAIICLLFPIIDYYEILKTPFILEFTPLHGIVFFNVLFGELFMNCKIYFIVMKNTSEESRKRALLTMYPMILFICGEVLLLRSEVFQNHTVEVIFLSAMVYGYYCSKLIISTMTKKEMPVFNLEISLFLALQILNILVLFPFYYLQLTLFILLGIFVTLNYYSFLISIIVQLLRYLNISF